DYYCSSFEASDTYIF
nr:immunoglobulin light chain junction region [Macaca mulatta]